MSHSAGHRAPSTLWTLCTKHAARSWLILALVTPACAPDPPDPDVESLRASIQAVYDRETGRLREITYDSGMSH